MLGTLKAYPLEEAAAAARNVMVQLGDVGVGEFAWCRSDPVAPVPMLRRALDHYRDERHRRRLDAADGDQHPDARGLFRRAGGDRHLAVAASARARAGTIRMCVSCFCC